MGLYDDSYYLLNNLAQNNNYSNSKLPPNWIMIQKDSGQILSAQEIIKVNADTYGYDAFRTYWRVSLDYKWFGSQQAKDYIVNSSDFLANEWNDNRYIYAEYDNQGNPLVDFTSISTNTGFISTQIVTRKSTADDAYSHLIEKEYVDYKGYWGDKENYYNQNWAWFITALYSDNMENLYNK